MQAFMDENFLLDTPAARQLYHGCAARMPVLDYHCHLSPQEIAEDRRFENLTQIWLGGDHYKWRLMRAAGVPEDRITGRAPDREKFQRWAETLPLAIGNPLYSWSHLELQRYFGWTGCLNGDTAAEVWELSRQKLAEPDMSARALLVRSGVRLVCTTDDPADDLHWHRQIREDPSFAVQVLPAWRPDRAMNLEKPDYPAYLARLGAAAGMEIRSFAALREALVRRMDYFGRAGCRITDHGVSRLLYRPVSEQQAEEIFARRLAGMCPTEEEKLEFQTAFLLFMGREASRRGWVMQLHYGCSRDNNRRMYDLLGPDTGYDCVHDGTSSADLAAFLDALEQTGELPKLILYSLNPNDNTAVDTVIGCFQNSDAVGKLQHGCAWWFNDHQAGIRAQLMSVASQGLLGNFIGMLTDSRSFLSYPRHEYFRRILCSLIGGLVENGEYPADAAALERLVKGICYNNAVRYFGFDLQPQ